MYQITARPYYDSINQCYKQILEIMPKPQGGPLCRITKRVSPAPLSPFRKFSDCDPYPSCFYALVNPCNSCGFLRVEDIPVLLNFLSQNGYQVDNKITRTMMNANTTIQNTLIFYVIETQKY